jgi:hypothetical protein
MRRSRWILLAAVPTVLALGAVAFVFIRAQHSLDRAGVLVGQEGNFPFEMRTVGAQENAGFEAIASPASYTAGTFYRGKLYLSGPGGLFVYGGGDELQRSYRVGIELPPAPLGQMVVGRLRGASEPKLLIATAGAGVLVFTTDESGGAFQQLLPQDVAARDVTSLLPLPTGELLIGTRRNGLLTYTGKFLRNFHTEFAGMAVTALAADATGFWVGTRDNGVRHWHGGQVDRFSADALPDKQVNAIAVRGDKVFVGTPLGVEEFDNGQPARVLAKNVFAHALFANDKELAIGSIDEGIQRVSLESVRRVSAGGFHGLGQEDSGAAQEFFEAEGASAEPELYAVMRDGLQRRGAGGGWEPVFSAGTQDARKAVLTDGNVSALAFGADGRLWVGYFDHGLDVLSADLQQVEHAENDHLFCVNRIVLDPRRKTMVVATANGLVLFDSQGQARQVMTKRDGLIADHVTDVAFTGGNMVLATPAGLTFVDGSGTQSLYAFQGLVNNHVYALGSRTDGEELLAGTLGGVSILRDESVKRNLTATNSGLKHNWVTAIVPIVNSNGANGEGTEWMVGTYGAGVMRLGADRRFTSMDGATRPMVVNPNAMLATGSHIFAGTLGEGLWVFSRATDRWRQVTAGLPSENVTALAERDGEVYVGTEDGLVRIAEKLFE